MHDSCERFISIYFYSKLSTGEIGLQPNLLPQPIEQARNANEAATYVLNLSQEQPDNPLLSTGSWLALSVKQQQESGETDYRTLWTDMTASVVVQAATEGSSKNR